MQSIETRLHFGLVLSLAALIGTAWWFGHETLHRSTQGYVLSRLAHDAEALLGRLRRDPTGQRLEPELAVTSIYHQPLSGHYYIIDSKQNLRRRSRSLWDQDIDYGLMGPGEVRHWNSREILGQRLLVRSAGYRLGNDEVTITVAEDLAPLLEVLHDFERLLALLAIFGFGLAMLLQRLIVRRTFRALEPVYQDIERLEGRETSQLTEQVPSEIQPLVQKVNRLLSVYGKRLERSRNAAGNLAHALKTPLNLVLQLLAQDRPPLTPAERAICREQIHHVRALVERELKRARIAGSGHAGSSFEPAAELPALKALLLRMYPAKDLVIQCQVDLNGSTEGSILADREDMLELLGTLLDNACKWAKRTVACQVGADQDGVRMCIEDDGPGCSEEELRSIGLRGARLDERVSGHGLGLSIAKEIVELYGGKIDFYRSTRFGGFGVAVRLPLKTGRGFAKHETRR
ncbi:sensor histidine kinase [Thiohalocapsa marina]|uniref:sensor histidine kinase n=1 Tax=Thiohalocapsa marina TaxID=424902 RepID=UPI0036DE1451